MIKRLLLALALFGPLPALAQTTPFVRTGLTVAISASNVTANAALVTASPSVWVCNPGTTLAYINFGDSTVTATTTAGTPLPAGVCGIMSSNGATTIAVILASSTATITATPGTGTLAAAGGGAGSGSGGAATIADGADVAQGTTTDAACAGDATSGCTVLSRLSRIAARLTTIIAGQVVTNAGTFATQLTGATNNINNIAGTISLPTGAATAANQATEIASLATIATNTGAAIPTQAPTVNIGAVGISQTTPGTTNAVRTTAGATGGGTISSAIAPATPAGVNLKASAGTVFKVFATTIQSTPVYIKLYNASSAPTCGSGTPVARFMVPVAATAANGGGTNIDIGDIGAAFGTGIGYCVTGALADNDTTAITAANTLVNIVWN